MPRSVNCGKSSLALAVYPEAQVDVFPEGLVLHPSQPAVPKTEARRIGIEVRSGLHSGECEMRGTDLAGIAVHIGSRIGGLAQPGEVLVSTTVKDLVIGSGLSFEDRGSHKLKGVPDIWKLYSVATA